MDPNDVATLIVITGMVALGAWCGWWLASGRKDEEPAFVYRHWEDSLPGARTWAQRERMKVIYESKKGNDMGTGPKENAESPPPSIADDLRRMAKERRTTADFNRGREVFYAEQGKRMLTEAVELDRLAEISEGSGTVQMKDCKSTAETVVERRVPRHRTVNHISINAVDACGEVIAGGLVTNETIEDGVAGVQAEKIVRDLLAGQHPLNNAPGVGRR